MSTRLPDRIDPMRLAAKGARLVGEVPLTGMSRLAEIAQQSTSGQVARVELEFDRDTSGRAQIGGQVEATVNLVCQRCLNAVPFPIDRRVSLVAVESYQVAENLDQDKEPLICGDEPLALLDLIEDELLLALPQEPMHQEGECATQHHWDYGDIDSVADTAQGIANPFAVLAQLKNRDK